MRGAVAALLAERIQRVLEIFRLWRWPTVGFFVGMAIMVPGILLTQPAAASMLGGATLGFAVTFLGFGISLVSWVIAVAVWFRWVLRRRWTPLDRCLNSDKK